MKETFNRIANIFFSYIKSKNSPKNVICVDERTYKGNFIKRENNMSIIAVNGVEFEVPDGSNVMIKDGSVIVGQRTVASEIEENTRIQWDGPIGNVICHRSMEIYGDVQGHVEAGGSVTCKNVYDYVDAGGSICCGDISGDADAGKSINCGDIGGDADAGRSIRLS